MATLSPGRLDLRYRWRLARAAILLGPVERSAALGSTGPQSTRPESTGPARSWLASDGSASRAACSVSDVPGSRSECGGSPRSAAATAEERCCAVSRNGNRARTFRLAVSHARMSLNTATTASWFCCRPPPVTHSPAFRVLTAARRGRLMAVNAPRPAPAGFAATARPGCHARSSCSG